MNTDMNYDMNDGTPPYDMPFDGLPLDDSSSTPTATPADTGFSLPEEDFSLPSDFELPGDTIDLPSDDVTPVEPGMEENFGEVVNQTQDEEESLSNEPDEPETYVNPPKKKGSKVLLPIMILIMGLILAGSLYALYGSNINIDFTNKIADNSVVQDGESDMTSEETTDENLTQNETGEETDESISTADGTESIDLDIARNRAQRGGQTDGAAGSYMPPIPGTGANQGGVNTAAQQNQMAAAHANYGSYGRLDPFNPGASSNPLFDVLVPPSNPTPDVEAQQLMTLKISGIMYTPDSPSAIINIAGSDQLVRTGDKFNGFSVTNITKDKVTVRNGSNSYTASVGEYLNLESVGVNAIPNLNRKFAGPYSKGSGRIIEINTLN